MFGGASFGVPESELRALWRWFSLNSRIDGDRLVGCLLFLCVDCGYVYRGLLRSDRKAPSAMGKERRNEPAMLVLERYLVLSWIYGSRILAYVVELKGKTE